MKRYMFLFLAIFASASLWLGGNIESIQHSAKHMIDAAYPSHYDITLDNGVTLKNTSVLFDEDVLSFAGSKSAADNESVMNASRSSDTVRAGFLSLILYILMASFLVISTGFATTLCIMYVRNDRRRRAAALRRRRSARVVRVSDIEYMRREKQAA